MTECTWKEEKRNRAVLVGLNAYSLSAEDNATETTLEELAALLETAGGECVGVVLQNKDKPDARTFIGEGKVDEVRELGFTHLRVKRELYMQESTADSLTALHDAIYQRALDNLKEKTFTATTYEEFLDTAQNHPGFIKAMWCGDSARTKSRRRPAA